MERTTGRCWICRRRIAMGDGVVTRYGYAHPECARPLPQPRTRLTAVPEVRVNGTWPSHPPGWRPRP